MVFKGRKQEAFNPGPCTHLLLRRCGRVPICPHLPSSVPIWPPPAPPPAPDPPPLPLPLPPPGSTGLRGCESGTTRPGRSRRAPPGPAGRSGACTRTRSCPSRDPTSRAGPRSPAPCRSADPVAVTVMPEPSGGSHAGATTPAHPR